MTNPPRLSTLRPRVAMATQRLPPRPKTVLPVYSSPEWRELIAAIIRARGRRCENPLCQTTNHGAGGRIYGDHIVELRDGGPMFDPNGIQLLCPPCHGKKTAIARDKRMSRRW